MAARGTPIQIPFHKLARRLKEVETEWISFGIQLGIDMDKLRSFEAGPHRNLRDSFAEMLQYWLDNATNPTWQAIFEALEAIGNKRLASKLKQHHRPDEKVLMELKSLVVDLEECTHVWFNLGLMLEVPMTQLNIISNPQPYSRHLHDTLHHWMDTSHDISWEVLIEALEQTSHRRLARELKEEFVQN